jgi:hypothetical protein
MDLDSLWKVIVPLAFLAIWALTALFNRDAKPLPNRVQGSPSPYGPRPPAPTRTTVVERSPTLRWSPQGTASPARSGSGNDDDIVILDSPRQQPLRPGPARGVPSTRRTRPKPVAPAKPAATAAKPKVSQSGISQTVNQQITGGLTIEPLSTSSVPSTSIATVAAAAPRGEQGGTFRRSVSVAALINSPEKIREAILVSEILQPPLALRHRMRRGGMGSGRSH